MSNYSESNDSSPYQRRLNQKEATLYEQNFFKKDF